MSVTSATFSRTEGVSAVVLSSGFRASTRGSYASLSVVPVADDANDSFHLLRALLTKAGYPVERATNGRLAWQSARSSDYSLILMDIEMPEMNGFEATRRIRDDERAAGRPGIPIVAVTASQPEECEPLCRNAGCTGFLPKPVRKAELLQLVASLVPAAVAK